MTPDEYQKQQNELLPKESREIKKLSNITIRLKKSSGQDFQVVHEDRSSEDEEAGGVSGEEMDESSEDEEARGSSGEEMDESSEEDSSDDDTDLIPIKGPYRCTICDILMQNRIYFIEHIVELHKAEMNSRSLACLRLRLKKHYEETTLNVINDSKSEEGGSSQSICDGKPGLTLGGPTEECDICKRRVYKSCMEKHILNCIERNSELTIEPCLIKNLEEGESLNARASGNSNINSKDSSNEICYMNNDSEDSDTDNSKNKNFRSDLPDKEFNEKDHMSNGETTQSIGIVLKKVSNEWVSSLLNEETKRNQRPTHYMTKSKIIAKKKEEKEAKKNRCKKAVEAWLKGEYSSVLKCANSFQIPYATLYRLIETGDEYIGSGRYSKCLTLEEEKKIVNHVVWRASIGCGVSWSQLASLINEVLLKIKEESPERMTGLENQNQWPNRSYVRRFAERHNLSLRKTNEISKGRQILTLEDLRNWQEETKNFLFQDEELSEAMKNPQRVFNQDESSIEMGATSQRVLNKKGSKIIFNVSSGSREHITASYTVNAKGEMVPPRIVYKGKRNVAKNKLSNLSETGKSGKWTFSVAERGYMTRELYCDSLRDLDKFLTENKIERPVVLNLDGATAHISLEAARLCRLFKIQPWLFKPNMTHILQPLDLTFFSSLKSKLKQLVWNWQCSPENAGEFLNRYTIVHLLRQATEDCLKNPETIPNGFKRAGIFPWDESMPDKNKLIPGSIFEKPQNVQDVGEKDTQESEEQKSIDEKENDNCTEDLDGKLESKDGQTMEDDGDDFSDSEPTISDLKTVPQCSLEDLRINLNKFEVVFLSPDQIRKFNMLRVQKKTNNDPLFQAWIKLKLATIQPKSTVVEKVLAKKMVNVPSRKRKRNMKQPTGAARYDPSSVEWVEILKEQEAKKREKENKTPKKKKTK